MRYADPLGKETAEARRFRARRRVGWCRSDRLSQGGVSLLGGTIGFKYLARQDALTAFENASMLLGGMGPVGAAENFPRAGKWFASLFALYAGLVFIIVAGLLIAPVFHLILHRFHWDASKR